MIALRLTEGLSVALIFGGIVTQFYAQKTRQIVGDEDHRFRIAIPIVFQKQILLDANYLKNRSTISDTSYWSRPFDRKRVDFWINTDLYR